MNFSALLRYLFALLTLGLVACQSNQTLPPLKSVPRLDLPRFMGDWYVFAHIPYSLEKGKVGTLDRYALRPDGKIQNSYLFRKDNLEAPLEEWKGVAWVTNPTTQAEWRVQFVWPFSVPYVVMDLDKNYQWAVIGYPSRKLAWVLSRKPQLNEVTYRNILARMSKQGYDSSLLRQVPQRKE